MAQKKKDSDHERAAESPTALPGRDRRRPVQAQVGERTGGGRNAPTIRVLVVDDDQVDRIALRRALVQTGIGMEFSESDAVLTAIEMLATAPFDCVFLDFNLPDGDGLTFLRGLRAAGISTPVVMLTGQQDEKVPAMLIRAGAADYIAKEALTPARLLESLRRVLPDLRRQ